MHYCGVFDSKEPRLGSWQPIQTHPALIGGYLQENYICTSRLNQEKRS